jgi:hypothetical protein
MEERGMMNIFRRKPKPKKTKTPYVPPFWETGLVHHKLNPSVPLIYIGYDNGPWPGSLEGRLWFRYIESGVLKTCELKPMEIEPHATSPR